jgi:hypothetical protein
MRYFLYLLYCAQSLILERTDTLQSTHLEHLEEILLRNDQTLEPLLLLYRAL